MRRSRTAFSLVEVLLALTLFAIAVTALSRSCFYALSSQEALKKNPSLDQDFRFVRQHMLGLEKQEDVEEGGTLETLNSGEATWSVSVETTDILDLFKAALTVEFPSADDNKGITREETLYLLRPQWTSPVDRSNLLQEKKNKRDDF
tara:strand:- start:683 stop:1123 length:441 start_codon:yes stop_codon:yes gene_type:complete